MFISDLVNLQLVLLFVFCNLSPFYLAVASPPKHIASLPGFDGVPPFHLETGYVSVDEENGAELFYYFVESEGNPGQDPVLLWLTGGDRCSVLSALAFEIGPFKFVEEPYNGGVPRLMYNPYSWTKVASILFVDWPVGAGFSFSRNPIGYDVGLGDVPATLQLKKFLYKWFIEHPDYLANPFYIGADSYAGKIAPFLAEKISEGVFLLYSPFRLISDFYGFPGLLLLGSVADALFQISKLDSGPNLNYRSYHESLDTNPCNPVTGELFDNNSRVPFAHGFGIISDQFYETITRHCQGEDYTHPKKAFCVEALDAFNYVVDNEISKPHVLYPKCSYASPKSNNGTAYRNILMEETEPLYNPPPRPAINCMVYKNYLSYFWANSDVTRDALGIKKGTVKEWVRCHTSGLPSTKHDIKSSIDYHRNVTMKGYRSLVYSGDHDIVVPFLGTQTWVRLLNFTRVDDWRAWHVDGQSAGFTISYSNNMTFTTIKVTTHLCLGGGHTAPEYQPERCFAMIQRWISDKPL
ncbi:hypothetical protein EJB05_28138 [Eragrostis curvula]|uniref:Serine carboxypeptidase-like 19 n=1 Tax=Eragrostis curvula TaxID=38414 RepID=A0A5J9UQG5_9POAL|nr:hypothetical protein EJB05_28138 [Eragrostis curvula]